ncbi:MAG: sigma-54 dependent transcriptional regulator [Myxococcota bacterium]
MTLDKVSIAMAPTRGPVAVIDEDPSVCRTIRAWLEPSGYTVTEYQDARTFLEVEVAQWFAVFLGVRMDGSGLSLLNDLQLRDRDLPVVVMATENDTESPALATSSGAYDCLIKPLEQARLRASVYRAVERRGLILALRRYESQLKEQPPFFGLVGDSAPMQELYRQMQRVLDSDVAVAIEGEAGTGKELVARAIHFAGRRASGPFVAINCAAIPEALHESELFGHERGAFTGAVGTHRGRFEQADGGTLFLDEVGEMSALTQASLLRAIQEQKIRRMGGATDIPVNVRIISSSAAGLNAEVQSKRFREDLFFRLSVYPLKIPPLRDRREDITHLVMHFLEKYSQDAGRVIQRVSPAALDLLMRHSWPGNVRELQNVVHRAMLSCDTDELEIGHLPQELRAEAQASNIEGGADEVVPLRELERRAIRRALRATNGSVEKAARLLGMGRATLYRRLARYGSEVMPE